MANINPERHRYLTLVGKTQLSLATPTNEAIDRMTEQLDELTAKHEAVLEGIKAIEQKLEWLNERERQMLAVDDKRSALRAAMVNKQADVLDHREHMLRIREQHMLRHTRKSA